MAIYSCTVGDNADVLTKKYLRNNKWGPNIGELGLYFEFAADNTFKTDANFEGGAYYSGKYEINNKRLVLKIIKAGEGQELIGKELSYKVVSDNNAIYFTTYLELENSENYKDVAIKKIWNHSAIVKNGEKRNYQNSKVETISDIAILNENTNYYQFPSASSKRFMFSIHDSKADKLAELSYIVPPQAFWFSDKKAQLILRTVEKDSSNIRWYYIDLPVDNGGYDIVKIEGSADYWNGSSLGWIKETDIIKITRK